MLKAICDGCNGVVWRDDVQNTDGMYRRRYSETPCVKVRCTTRSRCARCAVTRCAPANACAKAWQ
ncbi:MULTISPECIES: RusA family crossover junction endodeoxyribonuclease [unclassified Pseudomonas]|uniref:RusA family crossover junction endodeoxyribonuclease n=1 Tax=unclassified Pseudomonas TaxID=196821 RepID=UPI0024484DC9|nr:MULTISPECIES: RusA family crossover junction endodeoxyribonuclease [unclassified Pseudomonas]MDG9926917.1 RusA family crossover junction endodeoxyribonuclease [Pseudomonas sp. GD04042]MDH0484632.1 RusA family crossover junction endodeoxyribonuclease [Pseudomonas sp. GD04015]MDH0602333.1 RusA family crossover junction endodeoxyribonuclease [Pseudomonas sp. GD03869]